MKPESVNVIEHHDFGTLHPAWAPKRGFTLPAGRAAALRSYAACVFLFSEHFNFENTHNS
jgi:hypothetical protein